MDLTPCGLIRAASRTGIGLNLRDGQLHASIPAGAPPDLLAILKSHRWAIQAALQALATSADLRESACFRSDVATLTPTGREEAEVLTAELTRAGGLGQFVCDLFHTWNQLDPTDRAAACHAWQLVAAPETLARAA